MTPPRRRYRTDLTDVQWQVLGCLIPSPSRAGGQPSTSAASYSTRCCTGCAPVSGHGKAGGPRRAPRSWTAEREDHRTGGHGYDGAKKVNGRKRHLLVDTLGLLLAVHVSPANVSDHDGAAELLRRLDRRHLPRLRYGWADGGSAGPGSFLQGRDSAIRFDGNDRA